MSTNIFRSDFTAYKNVPVLESIELRGGKKTKKYDIVEVSELTVSDIDKYSLGSELTEIKSPGYLLPVFPKYNKELTGEHGQRMIVSLIGPSGSGKSTLAARLAKQWKRANKDNEEGNIILLTPHNDNADLKALKPTVINCTDKEKLYKNFVDDETRIRFLDDNGKSEFASCLLICDDIEGISGMNKKDTQTILFNILNDIIQPCLVHGRHLGVSLIFIKHQTDLNTPFTRLMQTESHYVGLFPKKGNHQKISYIMKNHMLLNPKYIKRILDLNPFYFLHSMRFPGYTICERQIIKP